MTIDKNLLKKKLLENIKRRKDFDKKKFNEVEKSQNKNDIINKKCIK